MTNIIVQPEVIKALAECVIDVIQNKIDWNAIDWQAVAEKAVERPKGRWILQAYEHFQNGNELYKYDCNICGHREEHAYSDSELSNFCPNCGADMRGGKEE